MSIPSGIRITDECITAARDLRSKRGPNRPRFAIFKVSDDQQSVVVEELSTETDYEVFRKKLCCAHGGEDEGAIGPPRYAVYDVEYDLGDDGKRTKSVFISWVPINTPLKLCMMYASTKEQLRRALDIGISIHADDPDEIEWEHIIREASGGRVCR